jgi:hypothetical protein
MALAKKAVLRIRIRIRKDPKLLPDPDPIRKRNKHFGSRFESGSEINQKKEPYIQAKIRWFHTFIHISVGHWINSYYIAKIYTGMSLTAEC